MTAQRARRQFWTYWTASTTSSVGSAVTAVALPLTAVLVLHAGPAEMGLLTAGAYVAWLVVGLPAGAIIRRLPLRGLQVTLDLTRALAVASVPAAWGLGWLTFGQLLAVALVISFANVFFDVASMTFLPRVVPREQLHARNSLMSGSGSATELGGPSLGGVLVQVLGAPVALLADTASYVVSAVLLRTLPATAADSTDTAAAPLRAQVRDGWRFVVRHPVIGPCMWSAAVVNFACGGQMALFAVYLVRSLHVPAGLIGLLLAAQGAGGLIGAAACPRLTRATGSARACLGGSIVIVMGLALIPQGTGLAALTAFAAGNILFGLGVVLLSTTTRTYRQVASPAELLSRVMATVRFVSWGMIPVGGLACGALAGWVGPRDALLALALVSVLAPLVLLLSPVRWLRDLEARELRGGP